MGERVRGSDRGDPADLLALALSRPAEALAAARELLATGPAPAVASIAHQAAGIVLRDFGDIDEAVRELTAARRQARAAADPGRETDVLATLGVALAMAGRTRRGLAVLDEAVAAAAGGHVGQVLIRRVFVLWLLGRAREALADAETAVTLIRAGGDPMWLARALNHRAIALHALGRIDRADADYAESERLFAASGQQLEYADTRQERGAAALARGDLPTALARFDEAQALVDELGVIEPDLHVNKCTALLAAGLARDALAEADSALARLERQRGSATRRAELLHMGSLAALAAGEPDQARARSAEAIRMFRRQHRPWWRDRAELVQLQCLFVTGDRSAELLRRARRVAAGLAATDPDRAAEANLLAGQVALARGDAAGAGVHLRIAARAREGDLREWSTGWLAQATLCAAEGRRRGMLAACDRGLRRLDLQLHALGATELRALATRQGAELAAVAVRHALAGPAPRAVLEWSERGRAVVLAVPPVRPPADEALAADLAALRTLTRRVDAGAGPGSARRELSREQHRLEGAVRRKVLRTPARDAPERVDRGGRVDWAGLFERLGRGHLVSLVSIDGTLHAVVAGRGRVRLRAVGPADRAERSLDHALFALRREGSGRGPHRLDLAAIGARLQHDLLGPVAELLEGGGGGVGGVGGGGDPVVIVPTGRLHAVPWGLMPALRSRPTSVAPSVSSWLRAAAAPEPATGTVLVGGADLTAGAEEVRQLAAHYPDAVVLGGRDATVARVGAAIDGARLAHIAAHGTFRADSPLFSALELDDGPLTVYDLEQLERAPHLVVLSSCNSAVGAPSGADELLGLVSALIALGSAGVLASVVPVDDLASVPVMLAVHRSLGRGDTLAAALARARDEVAGDRAAAVVASSFIALGA